MAAHCIAGRDNCRRYRDRYPSALVKFEGHRHEQNQSRKHAARTIDGQLPYPLGIVASPLPPHFAHSQLRQRKSDEHIYGVQNDKDADSCMGPDQDQDRGQAHRDHAILSDEPLAQIGEAPRYPAVHGHGCQYLWAADESRLGSDE